MKSHMKCFQKQTHNLCFIYDVLFCMGVFVGAACMFCFVHIPTLPMTSIDNVQVKYEQFHN